MAWRVEHIVVHFNVFYLNRKHVMFYSSECVIRDIKPYYKSERIVINLRIKSNISAVHTSKLLYKGLIIIVEDV